MIEEIKKEIDNNKKDKQTFNDYIKSFKDCEQVKELFENNNDFKSLDVEEKVEKKEEDKFF